jgi:hypothetical protein
LKRPWKAKTKTEKSLRKKRYRKPAGTPVAWPLSTSIADSFFRSLIECWGAWPTPTYTAPNVGPLQNELGLLNRPIRKILLRHFQQVDAISVRALKRNRALPLFFHEANGVQIMFSGRGENYSLLPRAAGFYRSSITELLSKDTLEVPSICKVFHEALRSSVRCLGTL